jgi:hypothetical protein
MGNLKRLFLALSLIALLALPVSAQSWSWSSACIDTAITTLAASSTATNGSEFTANSIQVSLLGGSSVVAVTITFTGDGSMDGSDIDFFFQASYDDGTTWSTTGFVEVDVASDTDHSSNVVRHTELVNVYGVSHLRLWKVVNNDAANSITSINATISGGKK